MQSAWVIAAAILFLGAGLGIGFLLMRQGRAAAVLAARQALEIEVASLRQQIRGQGDLLADYLRACHARGPGGVSSGYAGRLRRSAEASARALRRRGARAARRPESAGEVPARPVGSFGKGFIHRPPHRCPCGGR